ncbi:MAG: aminotransferase class I/II-fold pyridoxal phosphate-dependent enzyme [Dialister sp.]|nr:aminotransferase class I/II-fold pyridoxal phosphate-dependent enzyme [Dialister sp.]
MKSLAAPHAKGKSAVDNIFAANNRAIALAEKIGNDRVVNATVGSILDEEGNLVVLDVVQEEYNRLTPKEIAAYSPIQGYRKFLDYAIDQCFGKSRPEGYVDACATPGGTGVIHHVIHNYTEVGDTVLITDWHWGAYDSLIDDNNRKVMPFSFLTDDGHFNAAAFKEAVEIVAAKQDNIVVILNGIANNPTGYSMSISEWQSAVDVLKDVTKQGDKNVILVADVAYLDYSGEKEECRRFFKVFEGLPSNILVVAAYTLSKGFTLYGQRQGAMIGISSDKDVIREFVDINQYSSRATWSNCNSAAQNVLIRICEDPAKLKALDEERAAYYTLIQQRAQIFVDEAREEGIRFVPYVSGFFITIPVTESPKVCRLLEQDHVFMVPLKKGIRLAVCSVPKAKMKGLAKKLAAAIREAGAKQ